MTPTLSQYWKTLPGVLGHSPFLRGWGAPNSTQNATKRLSHKHLRVLLLLFFVLFYFDENHTTYAEHAETHGYERNFGREPRI